MEVRPRFRLRRPAFPDSIQFRAGLLTVVGILPVVGLVIFVMADQHNIELAHSQFEQVRQLQLDDQAFLIDLADEKAALNVFIYTAATTAVSPYEQAVTKATASQARLEGEAAAIGLAADAKTLHEKVGAWRAWAVSSKAAVAGSRKPLGGNTASTQGSSLFSAVRDANDTLAAHASAKATSSLASTQARLNLHLLLIVLGGAIAASALLVLGFLLRRGLLKPVVELATVARRFAAGQTVPVPSRLRADEIGELARGLAAWQQATADRLESEARFRAIFDKAIIGVARLDLEGRVLETNPALVRILGYDDPELRGRVLDDFMDPADAQRRIFASIQERTDASVQRDLKYVRKDGTPIWGASIASLVRGSTQQPPFVLAMIEDVTERVAQQRALEHQALHDGLTGLPNRVLLRDRLQQAILNGQREGEGVALLLMDLDRFKDVNDTFGHHHGDALLKVVGARLATVLRSSDTVARLGGDEFAVVLPGLHDQGAANQCASKILQALEQPFNLEGQTLAVAASIGIAVFPDHGADAETLIRHADIAMYVAKRGSGGYAVYTVEDDQQSADRVALVAELRQGIEEGQFVLYYQPEVDCSTGQATGVEALVRWLHPRRGLVLPGQFIPLAEQTGLIRPLGLRILEAAIRQQKRWMDQGLKLPISVNLSMRNLHDANLVEHVSRLLTTHGVPGDRLKIEITESTLMFDPERALQVLAGLKALGIGLAIDDFGTGYSSLAYLKRLPVDEIKIDKSFVTEMLPETIDMMIVRSTVDLGHNLGLKVIAEGVEKKTTWEMLSADGCDRAQGFYFARPMPADQLENWLARPAAA